MGPKILATPLITAPWQCLLQCCQKGAGPDAGSITQGKCAACLEQEVALSQKISGGKINSEIETIRQHHLEGLIIGQCLDLLLCESILNLCPGRGGSWCIPLPQEVTSSHSGTKLSTHAHTCFCCTVVSANLPGAVQGQRCLSAVEHTNPTPEWMWQLGSCVTRWEDKISIFHLPFLPHSPTSVPEWHLAVASLHSCVILAPDKFQPCQGLEWLRNKESLSPTTSVHHVDQKRQRN